MTALEDIKKGKHPDRIWATVNGMSTRLPDGARQLVGGWSQDAERAGSAEYVLASTLESLQQENEELVTRANEAVEAANALQVCTDAAEYRENKLREALQFYANPELYKPHPHGPAFDRRDLSYHARSALASTGGEHHGN